MSTINPIGGAQVGVPLGGAQQVESGAREVASQIASILGGGGGGGAATGAASGISPSADTPPPPPPGSGHGPFIATPLDQLFPQLPIPVSASQQMIDQQLSDLEDRLTQPSSPDDEQETTETTKSMEDRMRDFGNASNVIVPVN